MHIKLLSKYLKGRDHSVILFINEKTILKFSFKKQFVSVYTGLN